MPILNTIQLARALHTQLNRNKNQVLSVYGQMHLPLTLPFTSIKEVNIKCPFL